MSLGIEHRQTFPLALPQRGGSAGRRNSQMDGQDRAGSPDSDIEYLYTNAPPPAFHLGTRSHRPPTSRPRPHETTDVIHILDSDEDADEGHSPPHRARRLRSPPPIRHGTPLPRFALPFQQGRTQSPPVPGSASTAGPSRPRNGLGGGLLSIPRPPSNLHSDDNQAIRARREADRLRRQQQIQRRSMLSRAIDHVFGGGNPAGLFEGYPSFQQVIGAAIWFSQENPPGTFDEPRIPPANAPVAQPSYHPRMTHRSAAPPLGFTFDFDAEGGSGHSPIDVDDDTELPSSSKQVQVHPKVLICARCNEPLLLGPKHLWALRCGHMICGSCIEKLSLPVLGKGKGKQDESDSLHSTSAIEWEDIEISANTAGNGKGKGKERLDQSSNHEMVDPQDKADSSNRSRRFTLPVPSSDRKLRSQSGKAASSGSQPQPPSNQARGSKPGRSKRNNRSLITAAGTMSEEQEYHCPVEGCWRSHWSAKTWVPASSGATFDDEGQERGEWVWKQKTGVGAIPIFV